MSPETAGRLELRNRCRLPDPSQVGLRCQPSREAAGRASIILGESRGGKVPEPVWFDLCTRRCATAIDLLSARALEGANDSRRHSRNVSQFD